jgi:hypothetical protein
MGKCMDREATQGREMVVTEERLLHPIISTGLSPLPCRLLTTLLLVAEVEEEVVFHWQIIRARQVYTEATEVTACLWCGW